MRKENIELLAPAGSFACIHAAIRAGADAIYFGVEQLNMRTRSAASFTIDDICTISALCRENRIRSYITLNTVMYDHDMQLMHRIVQECIRHRTDAVIASDLAVINYCRQAGIPVHISTQANVSNLESVRFFSQFADVIVLARELSLSQVSQITREIQRQQVKGASGQDLKIELFVHGALCMAVSGKCYLSLHEQNASANRGACVQNCRRSYTVTDKETGTELQVDNEYIMSAKDLCTIPVLDKLVDSGVDVFKIEGRSKDADYVYTVTRCYRQALDSITDGSYNEEKIAQWMLELSKVYNRGFWEGYYLGRKTGEWANQSGSVATEKKLYIGRGSKYYPRIGVAEFIIETGNVFPGDTLMVISPSFGMMKKQAEVLIVNGKENKQAVKGDRITFPLEEKISPRDKLYKLINNPDA